VAEGLMPGEGMSRAEVLRLLNYVLNGARNVDDVLQAVRKLVDAEQALRERGVPDLPDDARPVPVVKRWPG